MCSLWVHNLPESHQGFKFSLVSSVHPLVHRRVNFVCLIFPPTNLSCMPTIDGMTWWGHGDVIETFRSLDGTGQRSCVWLITWTRNRREVWPDNDKKSEHGAQLPVLGIAWSHGDHDEEARKRSSTGQDRSWKAISMGKTRSKPSTHTVCPPVIRYPISIVSWPMRTWRLLMLNPETQCVEVSIPSLIFRACIHQLETGQMVPVECQGHYPGWIPEHQQHVT